MLVPCRAVRMLRLAITDHDQGLYTDNLVSLGNVSPTFPWPNGATSPRVVHQVAKEQEHRELAEEHGSECRDHAVTFLLRRGSTD